MAEAHRAAQHRGAGQMQLARLEHDGLVERPAVGLVVLADEDAEQRLLARDLHDQAPFIALRLAAAMWPSHTATKQRTTEPAMLPPAETHCPSCTRFRVWMLNDE